MPHVKVHLNFDHGHAFFSCFEWQYQKESPARTHGNCKRDRSETANVRGILLNEYSPSHVVLQIPLIARLKGFQPIQKTLVKGKAGDTRVCGVSHLFKVAR